MARSWGKAKGRSDSGGFVRLPFALMDSDDFRSLSGSATKVLMCLMRQYRGRNNGDLSAAFSLAGRWGIGSKSTLANALKELMACNLIVRTRNSQFTNPGGRCSLYALAWLPIDECGGKIEVAATITAPRKLSMERAKNPVQKTNRTGTETVPAANGEPP